MKRPKRATINKTYDDTPTPVSIPKEEHDEMVRRFLAAGGKIYKSKRGRKKGELTKAEITEHNKAVLEKQKQESNEEVNRATDKDGE